MPSDGVVIEARRPVAAGLAADFAGQRSAAAATNAAASRRPASGQRFSVMCNVLMAGMLGVAAVAALTGHTLFGFMAGAVLCGVAEAQGRCGLSHVGTLAPMRMISLQIWRRCAWGYTLGGLITSCIVGMAIGVLGWLAALLVSPKFLFAAAGLVGIAMLLREFGLIRFSPPQCDEQTHKAWMREFGPGTVATMWGAHIGLAVATVITHGGLYPILIIVGGVGLGSGAAVLMAFWLGRVIPLWLAPYLYKPADGLVLTDAIRQAAPAFRAVARLGISLLCAMCLAAVWLAGSSNP